MFEKLPRTSENLTKKSQISPQLFKWTLELGKATLKDKVTAKAAF